MTQYTGNAVSYGTSDGAWVTVLNVVFGAQNTGNSISVEFWFSLYFNRSVSDTSNSGWWASPIHSPQALTNLNLQNAGPGAAQIDVTSHITYNHPTQYGGGNTANFAMSFTGVASGGTGPSNLSVNVPVPARLAAPPDQPPPPTISGITQSSATINMTYPANNGSGIDFTLFGIYNAASGGALIASTTLNPAGASWTANGLPAGTTLYAEVQAHNGAGYGAISGRTAFTTAAATAPNTPAAPSIGSITQTTASMSWVAPGTNGSAITGYQLQVQLANGTAWLDTTDTASPYGITGMTLNTGYRARVRANSGAGYSAWSDYTTFTTGAGVPSVPGSLTTTAIGLEGATLGFAASSGNGSAVTGYKVQVSTDPAFGSTVYDTTSLSLSRIITGLDADEDYYWRVRAVNAVGNSAYSSVQSFTTFAGLYYFVADDDPVPAELWYNDSGVWKEVELWLNETGVSFARIM